MLYDCCHSCCTTVAKNVVLLIAKNAAFLNAVSKYIYSYSFLAGVDYLEHKNYYLSSELGYIRKGGKESSIDLKLDYFHINTTFKGKIPYKSGTSALYAGIGPKVDILLNSSDLEKDYLNKVLFGIKPEIGIYTEINKFRFDINFSYIYDFSKINNVPNLNNKLKNNTFLISLFIGYKISK